MAPRLEKIGANKMKQQKFQIEFAGVTYPCWYVKDKTLAAQLLSELMQKDDLIGIDVETAPLPEYRSLNAAGLSPYLSSIRLLQVFDSRNVIVFDLQHIDCNDLFIDFLESKRFLAHNAVFEIAQFYKLGVRHIKIGCTRILAKLLFHASFPNDVGLGASLADLSASLLGVHLSKDMQISNWASAELTMEQVTYAALDPVVALKIGERVSKGLAKFGLERVYQLTKDAQHPLVLMQLKGWKIDSSLHMKMITQWRADTFVAKKEVQRLTGIEKITSTTLGTWLESNLDAATLALWPRTETGRLATDANAFVDFAYLPVVAPFSHYQKKATLCSTFGNKVLERINPATRRLHGDFNLCGARTGRLSSSNPNLQNAVRSPSREEKAKGVYDFRDIFIASEGRALVCADFSQIELRVAAEVSRDRAMLQAYRDGIDLHTLTASRLLHKGIESVTKGDRQLAKAFNFGLLYGLGANKFSHYAKKSYGVEVSREQALQSIDIFRDLYSGYREWQLNQSEDSASTYTVRTPCGKLRKLDQSTVYGGSMNTPIQGGAAEVMLYSLTRMFDRFKGTKTHLVSTVHDEVIVECEIDDISETKKTVAECMIAGFLDVFPNGITRDLVEAKHGRTWGEAK